MTLALIHGGQPDALVVCHEPTRPHMRGLPDYKVPSVGAVADLALTMAQMVNPECKVIGISVNTSGMPEAEALAYLKELEAEYKMPAVDPFRTGVGALVDALVA